MKHEYAKKLVQGILASSDVQINGNRPWDIHVNNSKFYSRVLAGFPAIDGVRFPGINPKNICNKCLSDMGVQLEIPMGMLTISLNVLPIAAQGIVAFNVPKYNKGGA